MDPKAHDKHIAYVSLITLVLYVGKTVINKENTSRIYLTWQVHLKVPFVLPHRHVDAHFKQNKSTGN
jgi:hypothetical protein